MSGPALRLQASKGHSGFRQAHPRTVAYVQGLLPARGRVGKAIPVPVIALGARDAQAPVFPGVGQFVAHLHTRNGKGRKRACRLVSCHSWLLEGISGEAVGRLIDLPYRVIDFTYAFVFRIAVSPTV